MLSHWLISLFNAISKMLSWQWWKIGWPTYWRPNTYWMIKSRVFTNLIPLGWHYRNLSLVNLLHWIPTDGVGLLPWVSTVQRHWSHHTIMETRIHGTSSTSGCMQLHIFGASGSSLGGQYFSLWTQVPLGSPLSPLLLLIYVCLTYKQRMTRFAGQNY